MFDAAIDWQHAFVLHGRPYQDNKVIITLFTERNGKIVVVARKKTSKKHSKNFNLLQPFIPLLVTYRLKDSASLGTLLKYENDGSGFILENKRLFSALYLNELLMRLLLPGENMEGLYAAYEKSLKELVSEKLLEIVLRKFEEKLLIALGYGVDLKKTKELSKIIDNESYDYQFGSGFTKNWLDKGEFRGRVILNLAASDYADLETRQSAKKLFGTILKHLLGDRPLKSRELFKAMR